MWTLHGLVLQMLYFPLHIEFWPFFFFFFFFFSNSCSRIGNIQLSEVLLIELLFYIFYRILLLDISGTSCEIISAAALTGMKQAKHDDEKNIDLKILQKLVIYTLYGQ